MPLDDIADTIKAYRKEQEHDEKTRLAEYVYTAYSQAVLNAVALLNPKKYPKSVKEAFPQIFGVEQRQQDWREMKAYMQNFAKGRKLQRKGEQI